MLRRPDLPRLSPLLILFTLAHPGLAAHWSVNYLNDLQLDTSAVAATGLSGVTYLGPAPVAGKHRFLAVQDSGGKLITLDIAFSLDGNLQTATAVGSQTVTPALDYEGIVIAGDALFLSEENNPGVHQFDLATGNLLQTASIPPVFTDNLVGNRGFESLARNPLDSNLWTANEEALTVDGPASSTSAETTVRLLQLEADDQAITAGAQYAYQVEPIHAGGIAPQRGLSELVALPDGTLLALERSFAGLANPTYVSSLYEIDFAGATDLRSPPLDEGLVDNEFTPVGKELLWEGQAGGGGGQNLEGLIVGPKLPNGNWVLLGVVDDGDPFSDNTIVAMELSSQADADADFDQDTDIDGIDFLIWQRGFGIGTTLMEGDADEDGDVDGIDLSIWKSQFHPTKSPSSDYDKDDDIDGVDFLTWQRGYGVTSLAANAHGDSDHDGDVDGADLAIWQAAFGNQGSGDMSQVATVPEPQSILLWLAGVVAATAGVRRPSIANRGNRTSGFLV